ncbi:metalloregulator ArsR/SmtB family transcription factor [Comamonas terrigena]|uniref:metalloregulator ArsR/SmtB family transcription factor n=1 Tax=Comamonas terrigena TaxID=32013 RepID=UPI0028996652|nr:metalloregulator ArsR/SmtB family transcription factor [Comamonas terrigena]
MSLNEASPPPAVSELSVTATLDQDALRAHADEAVAMLKVLGNVDRLMLLCQLSQQERTVGELEQLTGISQPTLSQQLGVLRREGLVSTRREGKFICYQLADKRALQLMQAIHQIFCAPGEQA